MSKVAETAIINNAKIGEGTDVWNFANLWDCEIGRECTIGSYVEIGRGVVVGDNCKVEAYAFLPPGVTVGNNVFIGPHACFTNDKKPSLVDSKSFEIVPTKVEDGAAIGANATIVCGVTIGKGATVGAGSVVTKDVPAGKTVVGNPARVLE